METTNRLDAPSDCDHRGYNGCTSCGCSECGRKLDPDTRGPLTLPSGRVVQACPACLAEGESDGVPVAVDEERSGAQTVRLRADRTIKETGRDWAEKLSMMEVA